MGKKRMIPSSETPTESFDLIIIGGGIIGSGIARDAALRGLKVALFEREDYGYGTSSRSTRLIHGGLRYLEMLDFGLVRQDLKEREILLRQAPHLVKPLPFLLPFYDRSLFYRLKMKLGMILYDLLSYDKSLPNHTTLSRKAVQAREPGLNPEGLQGGVLYYDAQIALPERLCLENILDAQRHKAQCFNHTEVTEILRDEQGSVNGVRAKDRLTGEEGTFKGRLVLNATGVWLDRLTQNWSQQQPTRLRLTKGIHYTSPNPPNQALVLFAKRDQRLMFVIPWLGYAWVGTTDTDFEENPDTVHATQEEVAYLQETVQNALPNSDWNTVYFTNAGIRALVRDNRPNASESAVSRKHGIVIHTAEEGLAGMISVLGGKLTAYRDIAKEAVDSAVSALKTPTNPPSQTHIAPMIGAETTNWKEFRADFIERKRGVILTAEQHENLLSLYGTRADALLKLAGLSPSALDLIHPAYPDIRAQILFAIEEEGAKTVNDFLLRRTRLGFTPDQGIQALDAVVECMGGRLGWDATRRETEANAYRSHVALTQRFRSR